MTLTTLSAIACAFIIVAAVGYMVARLIRRVCEGEPNVHNWRDE